MALRSIRLEGDELLRKKSKPVKEITEKVKVLAQDMLDTMYSAEGVGLAAPQVGILKRIVVIDTGEQPYVMINPEIVTAKGEQIGNEACLSVPGKYGEVSRPNYVKAKATNLDGEEYYIEGKELLARAICHELDHLEGQLFIDIAKNINEDKGE